jgi:TonB family protein
VKIPRGKLRRGFNGMGLKSIRSDSFRLVKLPENSANSKEKLGYRLRLEKGIVISLCIMIVLFSVSRRSSRKRFPGNYTIVYSDFFLETNPQTSRGGIPYKPSFPSVPIPTEDELIPEYQTIEYTDLDFNEGVFIFDGFGDESTGKGRGGIGPRPIREVIPEYPEEERKKNVVGIIGLSINVNYNGNVDSVHVDFNTTGSKRLERSAVEAAYKSRYRPARMGGKQISIWIQRQYRFERR